jgi:CheY-like chemotaxis protein
MVDDDEVDAFLLRKAFAGGRVPVEFIHHLGGGELMADFAAADRAGQTGAPARLPNLILLDINMPAMDGFQVLRAIRAAPATRAVPVVMFTTSNLQDDVDLAYREGANGYFVKPGSMGELKRWIEAVDEYWFSLVKLPT